ncbi:efflux RND transporter periplasmic adaptor subunit [Xanthomonas phaseoli pv. dieffenbachiae]|uniref:efflux RND transporter periplasmic adaptor subunit n=1 Tax=Xanthomonas phaseoli TaxID=1985254 RepID=UPI001ADA4B49|nr:efflux RND transporter periplasmic adaptor subunit [Xanthomonas phaseoli]MBO9901581.1 efflux RND transporter periplasmic adaptor subunit [Xanthomonas phaseoli pv. dieffenbachiae]
MMTMFYRGLVCGTLLLGLAACSGPDAPATETPRAVKLERFGSGSDNPLQVPALVRQEQRAELGFEGAGRLSAVLVDVGDRVTRGQLLARLDDEPLRLREQQADANVCAALAQSGERQLQLRQQQAMFDDGASSNATLTAARAAADAAAAQLQVARADLAMARRGTRLGELRAPFDGSVVARLQQPQADVAAGQVVLQVEGQGRVQLVATLPATAGAGLAPGQTVRARMDTGEAPIELRLRSLSSRLDNATTVQALLEPLAAAPSLRSGDSVMLTLPPPAASTPSVPLSAVLPRLNRQRASVFVYQPAKRAVIERAVDLGTIVGERVQILRGLRAGEQVVSAGVGFLVNGQPVTPLQAQTQLSGGRTP